MMYLCIFMKSRAKHILAFFLAFTILISSSGVVLAMHTCLSSSKKQVSLFEHRGCCSKSNKGCHKSPSTGLKAKCCELSISYHKIDLNASVLKYDFSLTADLISEPFSKAAIFSDNAVFSVVSNKAPPQLRGGTDFLYGIHRLLI